MFIRPDEIRDYSMCFLAFFANYPHDDKPFDCLFKMYMAFVCSMNDCPVAATGAY